MRHVRTPRVFVVVCLGLAAAAAGPLADEDEEQDQDEDAGDEHHNADHLLQANVPGGGDEFVADLSAQFAVRSTETLRAVTLVGAVRILALASVGTRVLNALIDITEAPRRYTGGRRQTVRCSAALCTLLRPEEELNHSSSADI